MGMEGSAILVTAVDDLRVGVPIEVVGEVLRMVEVTDLPGAPDVVAGAVDVRGTVLPVLDLRRRLGRASRSPRLDDRLVSVALGESALLVWVDAVRDVRPLDPATVSPLQDGLAGTPHLAGVSRTDCGLLYLHDPDAFLSGREVAELDDALASISGTTASGHGA